MNDENDMRVYFTRDQIAALEDSDPRLRTFDGQPLFDATGELHPYVAARILKYRMLALSDLINFGTIGVFSAEIPAFTLERANLIDVLWTDERSPNLRDEIILLFSEHLGEMFKKLIEEFDMSPTTLAKAIYIMRARSLYEWKRWGYNKPLAHDGSQLHSISVKLADSISCQVHEELCFDPYRAKRAK